MVVYVALPLPEYFRAKLSRQLADCKKANSNYHWMDDKPLHITLSLLGDLSPREIDIVIQALKNASGAFNSFKVTTTRVKTRLDIIQHLNISYATIPVKFLQFKEGVSEMQALASKFDAELFRLKGSYAFREHIPRPLCPYVPIVQSGRGMRTLTHTCNKVFDPPIECIVRHSAVYVANRANKHLTVLPVPLL